VLDDNPTIAAKYRDFKIGYDKDHTFANNLLPLGYGISAATGAYAWDFSEIQIPNDPNPGDTTAYPLFLLGPASAGKKGLVHGYAMSRQRPHQIDPNVPFGPSWMIDAFDVGDNLE
jgi:hypothetical protein